MKKAHFEAFENVFKALEMPLSLKDAGISVSDEQIDEMVLKATLGHRRTLGAFKMLSGSLAFT